MSSKRLPRKMSFVFLVTLYYSAPHLPLSSMSYLKWLLLSPLCSNESPELNVGRFLQLDCRSATHTRKINLPTNQKGYDTFDTSIGKLLARRIQIYSDYFCLSIIVKVILNNFQNNA